MKNVIVTGIQEPLAFIDKTYLWTTKMFVVPLKVRLQENTSTIFMGCLLVVVAQLLKHLYVRSGPRNDLQSHPFLTPSAHMHEKVIEVVMSVCLTACLPACHALILENTNIIVLFFFKSLRKCEEHFHVRCSLVKLFWCIIKIANRLLFLLDRDYIVIAR